jgi:hypothetical protein
VKRHTGVEGLLPRDKRHSNDGSPYYCLACGAHFAEYLACDGPGCELEGGLVAAERRVKYLRGVERARVKRKESVRS